MRFQTISYLKLRDILKYNHLKFASDDDFNHFINKHPEVIMASLSQPQALNQSVLLGVLLFTPLLRESQHVISSCKLDTRYHKVSGLTFRFNIYNANHRPNRYWFLLNQELQHTKIIPLWRLKKRFLLKPKIIRIPYKFYHEWITKPQKAVKFNYINDIKKLKIRRVIKLYALPKGTQKQVSNLILRPYFIKHQIKIIKTLQPINTDLYLIGKHKYIIQSKPLESRVRKKM